MLHVHCNLTVKYLKQCADLALVSNVTSVDTSTFVSVVTCVCTGCDVSRYLPDLGATGNHGVRWVHDGVRQEQWMIAAHSIIKNKFLMRVRQREAITRSWYTISSWGLLATDVDTSATGAALLCQSSVQTRSGISPPSTSTCSAFAAWCEFQHRNCGRVRLCRQKGDYDNDERLHVAG